MTTQAEVKTNMTSRERREYRDYRAQNYPALDAKAMARATTAFRKAADSCAR